MLVASARRLRTLAVAIGWLTLAGVVLLLGWDLWPARFPPHSHDALSALPLALIAVAWCAHRLGERPTAAGLARTALLAAAFLFWSANQLWPESPRATLFNDLAVALFVLDLWLVMREHVAGPGAQTHVEERADEDL